MRLGPLHIAARHDHVEIVEQAAARQPLLRERSGGGGGERHRDAGMREMIEQQLRAGSQRNAGVDRRFEQGVAVGVELRKREVRAETVGQHPLIFVAMNADHRQEQCVGKRPAQRVAGVDERLAMRRFGIDERAVHVEDDGAHRVGQGGSRLRNGQGLGSHEQDIGADRPRAIAKGDTAIVNR